MDYKLELVVVPVSMSTARSILQRTDGLRRRPRRRARRRFRVVQLTPPGSACSISIGKGIIESVPGSLQGSSSCRRHRRRPRRAGRAWGRRQPIRHFEEQGGWADGKGGGYNSFIFFKDPDGNGWAIQESPLLGGEGSES